MKKTFILVICLIFLVFLWGCNKNITLDTPTDFKIEGTIISWTEVESTTKYRIELINQDDNSVLKRNVINGDDMNNLNIPVGKYMVKLQAIGNGLNLLDSDYTNQIFYQQIDMNAVSIIEEDNLVDGLYLKWMGRTFYNETTKVNMIYHSASGFEVVFKGSKVSATITATKTYDYSKPYLVIVLDDDFDNTKTISLTQATTEIDLIEINDDGLEHKLTVYKRNESIDSHIGLKSISTDGSFIQKVLYKQRKIEVIAASSSTGFGNLGTTSEDKNTSNSDALNAYAFLSAKALNAELNIVAASGWGVKASRWTTPNTLNMFDAYKKVDMFSTVDWNYSNYIPDVVVMNLGTNDWSYVQATDDPNEKIVRMNAFINQYVTFVNFISGLYPEAEIIILYGLMNEINIYDATIDIYNQASETVDNLHIFKVHGDGKGCSNHPSVASHHEIAIALTNKIKQITNW